MKLAVGVTAANKSSLPPIMAPGVTPPPCTSWSGAPLPPEQIVCQGIEFPADAVEFREGVQSVDAELPLLLAERMPTFKGFLRWLP